MASVRSWIPLGGEPVGGRWRQVVRRHADTRPWIVAAGFERCKGGITRSRPPPRPGRQGESFWAINRRRGTLRRGRGGAPAAFRASTEVGHARRLSTDGDVGPGPGGGARVRA